jgi:hypothetical protein
MADLFGMLQAAAGNAGNAGEEADEDFANTVLLLHGDGTNGAQNNTFLDASTNNFTITRNGNTTQGTFSPFSKPDGRWGVYFPTSSNTVDAQRFIINGLTAFGTSPFSIEFWIYYITSSVGVLIDMRGVGTGLYIEAPGGQIYISGVTSAGDAGTLPSNVWTHVAIVRSGTGANQTKIYINGVEEASGTLSTNLTSTEAVLANRYTSATPNTTRCYLSNVRFSDVARTITVPTAPYTSDSDTLALVCQSNRQVDNGPSGLTITTPDAVTPSVTPFSPFPITTAYSPSVNGGAGYFDGTGDMLETPSITIGTDAFCFECWLYPNVVQGNTTGIFTADTNGGLQCAYYGADGLGIANKGVAWQVFNDDGVKPIVGQWNHVAFVRSSTGTNDTSIFLNGVRIANGTVSHSYVASLYEISTTNAGGTVFNGYIADARLTIGSSPYSASSSTITIPTAPLTAITDTELLCNFTNAGILDNTGFNALETVADAQIDTSVKKYGTGSIEFDGTTDYVVQPTSDNYGYGTGDFTIEFWAYFDDVNTSRTVVSNLSGAASVNPHLYIFNTTFRYYTNGADRITSSALSTGQWYHIALCRASGSTRLFVDGTQAGSTYTDTNNYLTTAPLGIGTYWSGGSPVTSNTFYGYIDDLRITKGIARYTAAFTPPTKAFPDLGE